ncbi:protein kinase domain-containing protein [Streptosporangium sandarakinum]|uniref:serine/threonine-protein kinase n=1 Tax=Streptosporangium sandarakinum TaxID=1260955 RepID=UPI003D91E8B9
MTERKVAGRYHLIEPIGEGGMGVVWRAHDELLDRIVAIKEVRYRDVDGAARADLNRRTIREARSAGRLDHPSVIIIHDVVEEDGRPWIIMQLVRSRSLGQVVRTGGPLPPGRVAAVGTQVLGALLAAHTAGVLHRDVKPENVLLADDGRVVLTDFGIASMAQETGITRTGGVVGTPAFLPPERLHGLPATPASDLWSLGATLYAAVEGRPPFERATAAATMMAVLHGEPAPMSHAGPLATAILGLMAREPVERMPAEQAMALLTRASSAASGGSEAGVLPAAGAGEPAGPAGPPTRPSGRGSRAARSGERSGPAETAPQGSHPRYEPQGEGMRHDLQPGLHAFPDGPAAVPGHTFPDDPRALHEGPGHRGRPGHPAAPAYRDEAPYGGLPPYGGGQERNGSPHPGGHGGAPAAYPEAPPYGGPYGGAPYSGGPHGAVPHGGDPHGAAPYTGSPHGAAPHAESPAHPGPPQPGTPYREVAAHREMSPYPGGPAAGGPPAHGGDPERPGYRSAPTQAGHRAHPDASPYPDGRPGRGRAAGDDAPGDRRFPVAQAALVAGSAALAVLLGVGGWLVFQDWQPATGTAGETSTPSGEATASPRPSGTPRPTASPSAGTGRTTPKGWRTYRDRLGFTVDVPRGWAARRFPDRDRVEFRAPGSKTFLWIESTEDPEKDPVRHWLKVERSGRARQLWPGYRRIGISARTYLSQSAADWEFTYLKGGVPTHVLDRGFHTATGRPYAIYLESPESDWNRALFNNIVRGFRP